MSDSKMEKTARKARAKTAAKASKAAAKAPASGQPAAAALQNVDSHTHKGSTRANNPTIEHENALSGKPVAARKYRGRAPNQPRMVWNGRNENAALEAAADAPPIYQQEALHPMAMLNALRRSQEWRQMSMNLFKDFNGMPPDANRMDFYQHQHNWSNRIIHGDSLKVMASLCELENLRAQVQMIYFDPPYGINFNSNWQNTVDELDGDEHGASLAPEVAKAFRDQWKDGIHSYLSYIKDRLLLMRQLLADSGSVFLQISGQNLHAIGQIMSEVFGHENRVSTIVYVSGGLRTASMLSDGGTYLLWYAKDKQSAEAKFNQLFTGTTRDDIMQLLSSNALLEEEDGSYRSLTKNESANPSLIPEGARVFSRNSLTSQGTSTTGRSEPFPYHGGTVNCPEGSQWSISMEGIRRIEKAGRIISTERGHSIYRRRYEDEVPGRTLSNFWLEERRQRGKRYVVQTDDEIIARCMLMTTNPGDLVFDPTGGSGTTAAVAEKYGRRWIVADTSRVAISVARERLFGTLYPSYHLRDSEQGATIEREEFGNPEFTKKEYGADVARGFVCERVGAVSKKAIAENPDIDHIWNEFEIKLAPLRKTLPAIGAQGPASADWHVPFKCPDDWTPDQKQTHAEYQKLRIQRKAAMDASIKRHSTETVLLVDQPRRRPGRTRVAGPFTVESLSPHSACASLQDLTAPQDAQDAHDENAENAHQRYRQAVKENLLAAGVDSGAGGQKLRFDDIQDAPANCRRIHYLARYDDNGTEKKVAIMVGQEYESIVHSQVALAAREAQGIADWMLVAGSAFNEHLTGADKTIGHLPFQLFTISADLDIGADTDQNSRLFVRVGEPDITIQTQADGQLTVTINGVSIINPKTMQVQATTTKQIACWMLDTDYNQEAFFARHIYFPGKTKNRDTMLSNIAKQIRDIDADAVHSIRSTTSRPFPPPASGAFAVKVVNHFGDEVLKVFHTDEL